jgi:carbon-monoxide dehydrogenase small subunit
VTIVLGAQTNRHGLLFHNAWHLELTVNGESTPRFLRAYKTLLEVLREDLDLTAPSTAASSASAAPARCCRTASRVLSCLVARAGVRRQAHRDRGGPRDGAELHPLQAAFADLGAAQCGYCTPGILVTAKALLEKEPNPSRERIAEAISGNLCRCTGYQQIFEAIEEAAKRIAP